MTGNEPAEAVGVIGLGQLGLPIALRVLAAGLTVYGCARRPPSAAFTEAGGRVCKCPAEVADACPVVLTVLPSADALAEVASGPGGLAATTRRDGVWVEMSTVGEQGKRAAASSLTGLGWQVLDCPVSGAPPQVLAGTAALFSSGSPDAHDRALPVLHAISPKAHYVGAFGHGMRAKYTAHIMLAGHSLVAAEALAFAEKAGLSLGGVLQMMSGTINSSAVFEQRAPEVLVPTAGQAARPRSRMLGEVLADIRRLAGDIGAVTPVLAQALDHARRFPEHAADEPTVAFYHELAGSGRAAGRPCDGQEQA
jgi:3-hydroxyisobutyrate dehydrogenase-like beta-hydroxyacid dehydrogenase